MLNLINGYQSAWLIVAPFLLASSRAQGTLGTGSFVDLDFEQALLSPGGPPSGTITSFASAFPGWTGLIGGNATAQAGFNFISLGGAELVIMGTAAKTGPPPVLDGQFSALLTGGVNPSGVPVSASLSQSGLVPTGAASIQMKVGNGWGGTFAVTLGGTPISMIPLSATSVYTVYGGNIGALGGLNEQLTITSPASYPSPNFVLIDDITFSSQTAPEPGTLTLVGLGGLVVFTALRRNKAGDAGSRP